MNRKPALILRKLLHAAWRRRVLILIPFVAMAVASVAAAKLLPKTYLAKTLMMLQESGRGNVLQDPNGLVHDRLQERVAGLQALLQSDRVLRGAVQDRDPERARNPKWLADQLADLRKSVHLEVVGTDFLEIQLRASFADGLSRELESVTTRFLESLLPDQKGTTAIQLIAAERQQEVSKTLALVDHLKTQMAASLPDGIETSAHQLADADRAAERSAQELSVIETQLSELAPDRNAIPPDVSWQVPTTAPAENADGEKPAIKPDATVAWADEGTAGHRAFLPSRRNLESARDSRQEENNRVRAEGDGLRRRIGAYRKAELDLGQAEELLAAEREDYATLSRHAAVSDGLRSSSLLNAPERILVIDAPEDPTAPLVSRLAFVLSGLVGGALLGIALAVAAETLDPVIRYEDDLVEIAQLPLLATFPAAVRSAESPKPVKAPGFGRSVGLAAPAAVAAAFVLLALSGSYALGQPAAGTNSNIRQP